MMKKVDGFTLSELLLVLAIIGILILAVLPNQTSVVTKAKSVEAKLQLQQAFALQKSYFFEHSKYAKNLIETGYEQVKTVDQGGVANYRLSLQGVSPTTFIIRAESVIDFDSDGQYNVWEITQDKEMREVQTD